MRQQHGVDFPQIEAMTDETLYGDMAQDLVHLLGAEAALGLVRARGGLCIRVPLGITVQGQAKRDELVAIIGLQATTQLIAHYGGTMLYVPTCHRTRVNSRDQAINRERDRLAKEGYSERELVDKLALRYGLTSRHIWRILKKSFPVTAGRPVLKPVSAGRTSSWA